MPGFCRKVDRKTASLAQFALDVDPTIVFVDDPVRDRQPEASSVANIFGCKKRLEDVFAILSVIPAPLSRIAILQ